MYIDKNVTDENLLIIHNLLADADKMTIIKVFQYIKKLDNNWGFNLLDTYSVIDIQLTHLFNDLQLIDNLNLCKEEKRLAKKLLKEKGVLVVPGIAFGREHFLRVGFAGNEKELKKGLALLKEFLQEN